MQQIFWITLKNLLRQHLYIWPFAANEQNSLVGAPWPCKGSGVLPAQVCYVLDRFHHQVAGHCYRDQCNNKKCWNQGKHFSHCNVLQVPWPLSDGACRTSWSKGRWKSTSIASTSLCTGSLCGQLVPPTTNRFPSPSNRFSAPTIRSNSIIQQPFQAKKAVP